MKKKLIVLSSIVMFSIGLALYANNSSTMKVLSEDNIEALTDGEGEGSEGTYQELGTYPNRVWIFSDTHVMVLEGYKKTTNKKRQNECKANSSYICHVSTATPIYNASSIVDMIRRLLNTLFNGTSFFSWVFSLFK